MSDEEPREVIVSYKISSISNIDEVNPRQTISLNKSILNIESCSINKVMSTFEINAKIYLRWIEPFAHGHPEGDIDLKKEKCDI